MNPMLWVSKSILFYFVSNSAFIILWIKRGKNNKLNWCKWQNRKKSNKSCLKCIFGLFLKRFFDFITELCTNYPNAHIDTLVARDRASLKAETYTCACDIFACSLSMFLSLSLSHSVILSFSLSIRLHVYVTIQTCTHTYTWTHTILSSFFPTSSSMLQVLLFSLFNSTFGWRARRHHDYIFIRSFCSWFLVTTQINRGQ